MHCLNKPKKERAMFIGSKYKLEDDKERESTLGFKIIEVRERVLFRKRIIVGFRIDIENDTPESYDKLEVYEYMLYCMVNGGDTAEILEDELSSEITHGCYKYIGLYNTLRE
tara:strand:+ start:1330 stop:1665 length:336 start_codon:yes stop_codon:yes gene_type:complete